MSSSDTVALCVTAFLGVVIIVISVIMLCGKGAMLIAGFNTMPKAEREKYDARALCKFIGGILLPVGVTMPAIFLGGFYKLNWLIYLVVALDVALVVFAIVFANTRGRFRKSPSASDDGASDAADDDTADGGKTHDKQ